MSQYKKYPRTVHLPWSPGATSDDVRMINTDHFIGKSVVVTEKMDGENTSLYRDHSHARSLDSRHHASRDWVKRWHCSMAHEIPENWRVCGENMYAQHSVIYTHLNSYFYGFSLWDAKNHCLSWTETEEWFDLLGIHTPPILYRGVWDEDKIKSLVIDEQTSEGYVVRLATQFTYADFARSVAKWVRPHHVQTDQHWMFADIKPNGLQQQEVDNESE
ncbi:MAG: RNA ligase family protein [Thiotrichaceae bacterium]|nr:RNA ligase family protein [Thiotrichaceae bacterium]